MAWSGLACLFHTVVLQRPRLLLLGFAFYIFTLYWVPVCQTVNIDIELQVNGSGYSPNKSAGVASKFHETFITLKGRFRFQENMKKRKNNAKEINHMQVFSISVNQKRQHA